MAESSERITGDGLLLFVGKADVGPNPYVSF